MLIIRPLHFEMKSPVMMRMNPAHATSSHWCAMSASCIASSSASRVASALWSSATVAMPWAAAVARPLASGRLEITQATS
jgi:hypothetical protein